MISLLAQALVFGGTLILAWALVPIRGLIGQLPSGAVRNRWYVMTALIVLFLLGYVGYAAAFWNSHSIPVDLIVPGVFFFGACFVWLTGNLSLQTAMDVMRVGLLERETLIDPLTGVFNRRYLDRCLSQEVASARRYGLPFSVLLLDIDHFKQINDGHGHQVGDEVLASLAKIIAGELRDPDVVARYGGEEFLVMTVNTPPSGAIVLAERLRKRIESHGFNLPGVPDAEGRICATVSIGVASLGDAIDSAEKLVHAADRNLYRAKYGGRNQVIAGAPAPASAGP